MQRAYQHVLRAARPHKSSLLPVELAYTSIQWQTRRGMANPISWLRDRLTPAERKPLSDKEEQSLIQKDQEKGVGNLFDSIPQLLEKEEEREEQEIMAFKKRLKHTQHKVSTSNFKISLRKLNMLGRQISGKPIDHAILQMQFSQKRASKRIKSSLVIARKHAVEYKELDRSKLIVAEAWVTKGKRVLPRLDIKGRGRMGMKHHPDSKLTIVLKEGKTVDEKMKKLRERRLKKIKSPGFMREDKPLVNVAPRFAW